MLDKSRPRLYFKEFIKTDSSSQGIDKIKKTADHVCDLLVYEPRNIEEAQLGTLFMLGKIENIPKNKFKNLDFLLNLLISVVKREFYSDSKRPALEALEASLNKANLYLADFTEKGNDEWIGNLDFICGALSQNTLHISQVGTPIAKLFRGTAISHIENKFPTRKKSHPIKTFGNIASGAILNGDKIILGTKNILNITPLASLRKLSRGNCYQIIEALKDLAKHKTNNAPIICLAFEIKTERAPEEIAACVPAASTEQNDLIKEVKQELKRAKRAKIKTTVLRNFYVLRKFSIIIFLGIYKIISFLVFVSKKMHKLLTPIFRKISEIRVSRRIRAESYKLTRPILLKIKALFERSKVKDKYHDLRNKLIELKNYKITIFYQKNKPAFFVASALIILILILPFAAAQKINFYIKTNNFNKLSAEIQENLKEADAALIYQDEEKAKASIQKNQALFANLLGYLKKSPFKNNEETLNKTATLQKRYQEQQDSIDNIKRIKELEEILNFSTSGFIVNPIGLNKIKDNLYFYEFESGILYKFKLGADSSADGKKLMLIFISAKDELRKMVSLENERMILFGQSGKAYLYNSNTNNHTALTLDPAMPVEKIKDAKSFFSNIYILDAEQGNIVKYSLNSIKEETIEGSSWLLEPIKELKNAQSMAIDGSIYVLNSDGLITKYFKGKKAEEIQPLLKKSLGGENKIFTADNFANFYISDPKNKRLITLNKKGEAINQYVNDELANLQDFWVTKDEKEVYLLCGKKVFKLEL